MLIAYEEEEKLFDAIKAGAQGYILKSSSPAGLLGGIRGALDGESSIPRKLARQFLAEFSKISKQPGNLASEDTIPILTHREREILDVMASGASNQPTDGQKPRQQYFNQATSQIPPSGG